MGDSYWWSSILRNIRLASDLMSNCCPDLTYLWCALIKMIPNFWWFWLQVQSLSKAMSYMPIFFTLHMIRISITFQLSKYIRRLIKFDSWNNVSNSKKTEFSYTKGKYVFIIVWLKLKTKDWNRNRSKRPGTNIPYMESRF